MLYFYIAIGGALGSMARFWLNNFMAQAAGAAFPWGTLLINVIGSFVIGFFGSFAGREARLASPEIGAFVMVGLCGGFTTFSAFSLQTVQLARAGEWARSLGYIGASVGLCLLVCRLGMAAGCALAGPAAPAANGNGATMDIAAATVEEAAAERRLPPAG